MHMLYRLHALGVEKLSSLCMEWYVRVLLILELQLWFWRPLLITIVNFGPLLTLEHQALFNDLSILDCSQLLNNAVHCVEAPQIKSVVSNNNYN